MDKPPIVCLCGSTKFLKEFAIANSLLTLQGKIVLSIGIDMRTSPLMKDLSDASKTSIKKMLDELHLRKIDLADEVFVVNPDGYIGESTRREIEYALKVQKPVKYLYTIEPAE